MNEREFLIKEEGSLKKYRTEIPNTVIKGSIADKLSVYDKFLYVYLKSVAGESGACWQSTSTISNNSGISAGKVSECKKNLAKFGLINVEKGDSSKSQSDTITINDIWVMNMKEFGNTKPCSSDEHPSSRDEAPSSSDEIPSSCDEMTPSPHEPKNNPNKEEPYKEKPIKEDQRKLLQEIFEAYPRKIKKEVALREIERALKILAKDDNVKKPEEFLLKKTKLFAEANRGTSLKFIQYPENWFSQKRYYENPTVWMSTDSAEKKSEENPTYITDFKFNVQKIRGEHLTNFKDRDEINNPQVGSDIYEELQENLEKKYV